MTTKLLFTVFVSQEPHVTSANQSVVQNKLGHSVAYLAKYTTNCVGATRTV